MSISDQIAALDLEIERKLIERQRWGMAPLEMCNQINDHLAELREARAALVEKMEENGNEGTTV